MRTLTLWATSGVSSPTSLQAGIDLALDVAPAHGLELARGVALDDYLDAPTRAAIDVEMTERYVDWRASRAATLTAEQVDLTHVWEVELLARCFLPAVRLKHSLAAAIADTGARRLIVRSAEPAFIRLAGALAGSMGVSVTVADDAPLGLEVVRQRSPSLPRRAFDPLGVPPRARGEVLCVSYWNLEAVVACLAKMNGRARPVASDLLLPGLNRLVAIAAAMRGGWLGTPSRRARVTARVAIAAALRAAAPADSGDPFELALDQNALDTLGQIAQETLAVVRHARRALAGGRIRVALLPFDSPAQARMLLVALSEAGVSTLLVQHGFSARLGDTDMCLADHIAVWSERDRSLAPGRDPTTVTVSGNPGVTHLVNRPPRRRADSGRSVILVDYAGRLSAQIDGRISMAHVATALQGLAAARPGTVAIVRPHPGDQDPTSYAALAPRYPELRIELDVRTPIESLLASCDLCVGGLSTATLQACVLGVPTVFLNVIGLERPWPFTAAELPTAIDAESLADEIATVITLPEAPGRGAALDALGVRHDAVERVLDLIDAFVH
jgi:hypothetical protein